MKGYKWVTQPVIGLTINPPLNCLLVSAMKASHNKVWTLKLVIYPINIPTLEQYPTFLLMFAWIILSISKQIEEIAAEML